MQRLYEPDRLNLILADFLSFCRDAFLCDEFLGIYGFSLSVCLPAPESNLYLRMSVVAEFHKVRTFGIGNERYRSIVADIEAESLDIECLDIPIIIQRSVCPGCVKLAYLQQIALVAVAQVSRSRIVGPVPEYCKYMVSASELSEIFSSRVFVQSLDVCIEPDILSSYGGDALALQEYLLDRILGHKVAS